MYERIWKQDKIAYGGDYNPEQWDEKTWEEDMRLFKLANINTVTLNVFSWAALQPDEDTYSFDKLDKIMNMVRDNNLKVVLATSTAAHPAWMAHRYPEVLRVEYNGMKRKFGGRHNSCPNSEIYRKYSTLLARKLAERYKDYDNIIAWHISNEYGGECYCDNCQNAFRRWIKKKYKTLDEVNRVYNTSFWGHTFYDWDEIVLPNALSEHFDYERTMFQGISLDYRRFMSDSILDCYKLERDAVKEITPDIPVTTNLMGFYKPLDYQKWGKEMDFISWDNYPSNEDLPYEISFAHELMRGVGDGKPFILMEQTPSVTNWLPFNALKRPGVMRLWSYQAMAHGSDSVMFFQMRRSIGACEKYHGAIIDHVGNENTRVFREAKELGSELSNLGDALLGTRIEAKVAIMFDWDKLILPFLVLTFMFSYYPLHGWIYALFDYRAPLKLSQCEFVGMKWFKTLFSNPTQVKQLIVVMKNTFAMSLLGIATSFLPVLFAVFLNEIKCKWFKNIVQTLTTLPNFISWTLVYSVAFCLFSSNGMLNSVLQNIGFISEPLKILDSGEHVWLQMVLWNTWKGLGWGAIMYLAAIAGIDQELYEAAKVDGAGRWAIIKNITIPSLMPTYFVMLMLSVANFLNNGMDQYFVFQNAFNKQSIQVLDLYVYNIGMTGKSLSLATAIGVLKSLVSLVLLSIVNFVSKKTRGESII